MPSLAAVGEAAVSISGGELIVAAVVIVVEDVGLISSLVMSDMDPGRMPRDEAKVTDLLPLVLGYIVSAARKGSGGAAFGVLGESRW